MFGWAQRGTITGSPLMWSLDNGVLAISGVGVMPDFEDNMERPWHTCIHGIASVVIGPGVTGIGPDAFAGCKNLVTVDLGRVQTIGDMSFTHTALTSVAIPASVAKIGDYVFCYAPLAMVEMEWTMPPGIVDINRKNVFRGISLAARLIMPAGANPGDYAATGWGEPDFTSAGSE
ncbi:hypothetical protein FACS189435_3280 [Bacteroidia bacterium]|nr:hypothetical protein FACS189435_3280 [Bacteroidia bacterium]